MVWNEENPEAAIGRYSYVVGAVRFQQKRNLFVDCASLGVIGPISAIVTQQCLSSEQNRSSYGLDSTFSFDEVTGFHVTDIVGTDVANATKQIQTLMQGTWIDSATKLVEVILSVYNAQLDSMLCFTFKFKVPASSEGLRASSEVAIINWGSSGPWAVFVTLIESLLIVGSFLSLSLLIIGSFVSAFLLRRRRGHLLIETKKILGFHTPEISLNISKGQVRIFVGSRGKLEIPEFSTWMPAANAKTTGILSLLLLVVWSALRIATFSLKQSVDFSGGRDEFIDLQQITAIEEAQSVLMSLVLVLLWLRLCADLQIIPTVGPMIQAVISTMIHKRVIMFILFVLFFCFSFAISCVVYFGYHLEAFWTLDSAVWTIFTNNFDLVEMRSFSGEPLDYNPMGVFFFIVMFIFITLTLLNIFIGLTGDVYNEMYSNSSSIWLKEVNDLMENNLLHHDELKNKFAVWQQKAEGEEEMARKKAKEEEEAEVRKKSLFAFLRNGVISAISSTACISAEAAETVDSQTNLTSGRRVYPRKQPCVCSICRVHAVEEIADITPNANKDTLCNFPNLMDIEISKMTKENSLALTEGNTLAQELIRRLVYRVTEDTKYEDIFSPDERCVLVCICSFCMRG